MRMSTPENPYFSEPDSEYFAADAIGSTDAKVALACPARFLDSRAGLIPDRDSRAFALGRAWDRMMTAGTIVLPQQVAAVVGDRRRAEGKEAALAAQEAGLEILTADEMASLKMMHERLPDHIAHLRHAAGQQVVRLPRPGWVAQGKMDLYFPVSLAVYDVKTTSKPLEEWAVSAYRFGYHIQAGWYLRLIEQATGKPHRFAFFVTETESPWRTALFRPSLKWEEHGRAEAIRAENIITDLYAFGAPPVAEELQLDLPAWVGGHDRA